MDRLNGQVMTQPREKESFQKSKKKIKIRIRIKRRPFPGVLLDVATRKTFYNSTITKFENSFSAFFYRSDEKKLKTSAAKRSHKLK